MAEAQSTHDIAEKWNRLEESVNNRTKALEMHRKQLEDHGTHAYPPPLSRTALFVYLPLLLSAHSLILTS